MSNDGTTRRSGTARRAIVVVALFTLAALAPSGLAPAVASKFPQASGRLNSILGDCGGAQRGGNFGTVWVRRLPGDLVGLRVQIRNGQPNETYVVNITCGAAIGTMTTDGQGYGDALFGPVAAAGDIDLTTTTQFSVDVHIDDAGASDKAQTPRLSLPLL